jgi:hypothetical protein
VHNIKVKSTQELRQGGQWNSTGFDVQVTSCWGLDEAAVLVLLGMGQLTGSDERKEYQRGKLQT